MSTTPPSPAPALFHANVRGLPVAARISVAFIEGAGVWEAVVSHPDYRGPTAIQRHDRGTAFVQVYTALVQAFGEPVIAFIPDGEGEVLVRETVEDPEATRNAQRLARGVVAFARAPSALFEAGKAWAKACATFKPGECARHESLLASREKDAQDLVALALQVCPDASQAPKRPV